MRKGEMKYMREVNEVKIEGSKAESIRGGKGGRDKRRK